MDSEALRTFLAVRELGGFSSAAAHLNRSQPAISRRIALLESELGVPLFERVPGGVTLSEAGEVLESHARLVISAIQDCEAAIEGLLSGSAGRLSVATVGTLAGTSLTAALKRFSSVHPGADLRLRTANSSEVSELVRSGEVAIGVRYHADRSADLHYRKLSAEPLQVTCATEHPLAGTEVNSLRKLASERWLTFPNALRMPETSANNLSARFETMGVTDVQWIPVDSLTAQKRLVEAGYGLAVLPVSATEEEVRAGTLSTIRISRLNLANPVYLVTRHRGYLSPLARTLIDILLTGRQTKSK